MNALDLGEIWKNMEIFFFFFFFLIGKSYFSDDGL